VTFSEPITAGNVTSLTGLATTGFSGLGTNTLTWTFSPISLGSFATSLLGTGANALKDAAGNALYAGAGFSQAIRVLYGDVNDDGYVASNDMVQTYGGTAAPYNLFLDVNGDGVIDIAGDVMTVRSRIGTLV